MATPGEEVPVEVSVEVPVEVEVLESVEVEALAVGQRLERNLQCCFFLRASPSHHL
jgi:hypothetical protein